MKLILTEEFHPPLIDNLRSLKKTLSGSRWIKLKNMIIEERGERCEICHCDNGLVDAHELWEYIDAGDAGVDPGEIQDALATWNNRRDELDHKYSHTTFMPRSRPMVRALVDIRLLCKSCHVCKHTHDHKYLDHWCRVNQASAEEFHQHYRDAAAKWNEAVVIGSYFSGYEELPDYDTFNEWREAMDQADAWHEDDWIRAENEMNDGWRALGLI